MVHSNALWCAHTTTWREGANRERSPVNLGRRPLARVCLRIGRVGQKAGSTPAARTSFSVGRASSLPVHGASYVFSPSGLPERGSSDFSEKACASLVPEGPGKIAGGKLAVGERRPQTRTPEWPAPWRGAGETRRRQVWSGPGFVPFFPRPSRAQNRSVRPSGGCARGLACPRLFSVVPPGQE